MGRILVWLLALIVALLAAVVVWFYVAPPGELRVASGYAAKIVCSNVFLAGRDGDTVLAVDVQAPGHPLLRLVSVDVDREAGTVEAGIFGLFGGGLAVHREGAGCAAVPDGDLDAARRFTAPPPAAAPAGDAPWPQGERVAASQDPALAAVLDDDAMTGPGMRAVVVVHGGRIVAERYGEGFAAETPLLGWSMTKTVTAALVGRAIGEGMLTRAADGLFERWQDDGRAAIDVAGLLAMASGLAFNEDYGAVADVTRMLYLEPDMAGFAAAQPLEAEPGSVFSYSSGTSVLLSRVWQEAAGGGEAARAWPRTVLFGPLGMTSAVLETDARGTFVGSSYLYATARDWARFGLLLLRDGVWQGERLLPEGYVAWMRTPTEVSGGRYGRHVWLEGPDAGLAEDADPDAGHDLPDDAYWLRGHDGQTVTVIPSRDLVVVRMGLTPSDLGYRPQAMVAALAAALR